MNNTNADKMKSKELRKIIREAIAEVLAEGTVATTVDYKDKNKGDKVLDIDTADTATFNKLKIDPTVASVTAGNKKIKEGEIDELARIAKGYRLTDDNVDTSGFTKTISGTSLADVINYFRENPGADKKALQTQFNFARPQIANAIVNGLMDAGVLIKLGAGGEEEPAGTQAQAPAATDAEDMFVGGAENPLAMYFDGEPNTDGSEDFEPEAGEIEKAAPVQIGKVSDADFEASLKYSELDRRLAATKSNILKLRKGKGAAGDISDKPSTELQRLRDLKISLEQRIADLLASSAYVRKIANKEEPEDLEMPDTEEESIQEMDQYDINKLKFYAGIIK
jgi:hypothetical protein